MRIQTVVMALALLPAAACVIEDQRDHGHGDAGPSEPPALAAISARWAFRNMVDGATTACPTGFDTVRLISQPVDADGAAVGEPAIDLYDCGAKLGSATDLWPDVYQVWVEVMSHDLRQTYARSLSQILDVREADARLDADILNDGGFFQLSWDLVDKVTQRPLSCATAGRTSVVAVSTSVADAHRVYDDVRPCDDHVAVTDGLLAGAYTVTIGTAIDDAVAGTQLTLTGQTIGVRNKVTDLGTILLPIEQ